ncbi:MAG: FAD-dependent oxidoreductase [Myxococcota bacterium]
MGKPKFGIVGAGIAGTAAAWSLHRAGHEVELFEKAPAIGGNAKTFRWASGDRVAESPLLVIAWPEQYYHNYHLLLEELGIGRTRLPISYFVKRGDEVFRQDGKSSLDVRFAKQFRRWDRLVRFVTAVCAAFLPKDRHESLYHFSYFNPMNVIPLYWLARLFGVSREFWDTIFVPVHAASFITTKTKWVPAVVLPLLEGVVPLEKPGRMATWEGPPRQVFERMTAQFADHVHTNCEIKRVARNGEGYVLEDQQGNRHEVDQVVFGCDAPEILDTLDSPSWLQRVLFKNSQYVDDLDPTFSELIAHSDDGIFPEPYRTEIGSDFNTYVEMKGDGTLECTFVLSSQYPGLQEYGEPMLVTFNSDKDIGRVQKRIPLHHPNHTLSIRNLIIMSAMRFLQGKDGLYYCGTFTTPEGAHDISFMSGLVAARAAGAPYPLPRGGEEAFADYQLMQRMMLGRVLPTLPNSVAAGAAETAPIEASPSLRS